MAELIMQEETSTPSTPASGKWKAYFKSDGLYIIDDIGAVIGPIGNPTGFIFGLTLSNNATDPTNDIDIAVGEARDIDHTEDMILSSAETKRLDATYVVGTNQGMLDTGVVANGTYHIFLIKRTDTGVVGILASLSATAPTMPTNYTKKRRIGSIVRTGGAIKPFVQDGDKFIWKAPASDVNAVNPGTGAVTRTLTVPLGIRVEAIVTIAAYGADAAGTPGAIFISDLSITDTAPGVTTAANAVTFDTASGLQTGSVAEVFTNTSGQVRSRIQISTANTTLFVLTLGWIDTRGRLY